MSDSNGNKDTQIINGDDNVQVRDHSIGILQKIGEFPVDKFLVAFLISSIIIQGCSYISLMLGTKDLIFPTLCSYGFILIFGIQTVFSLVYGVITHKKRIIILSIVSLFLSFLFVFEGYALLFLLKFLGLVE